MRYVYLLRHAKSSWDAAVLSDHERPLNRRGVKACALMGKRLARLSPPPGLILCSPAVRTRQTLELIRDDARLSAPVLVEEMLYLAPAAVLLRRLRRLGPDVDAVLVIGHNPGLQELACLLAGNDDSSPALNTLSEKFPTAALAELALPDDNWRALAAGSSRLRAFTTPKNLA